MKQLVSHMVVRGLAEKLRSLSNEKMARGWKRMRHVDQVDPVSEADYFQL